MELLNKLDWNSLQHEYGLDGKRLLPWDGLPVPFGGAYCVVRTNTRSTQHVNHPIGEEELFIAISGKGAVWIDGETHLMTKGDILYIPAGCEHAIENNFEEDFHLYAIWWNRQTITDYLNKIQDHG